MSEISKEGKSKVKKRKSKMYRIRKGENEGTEKNGSL